MTYNTNQVIITDQYPPALLELAGATAEQLANEPQRYETAKAEYMTIIKELARYIKTSEFLFLSEAEKLFLYYAKILSIYGPEFIDNDKITAPILQDLIEAVITDQPITTPWLRAAYGKLVKDKEQLKAISKAYGPNTIFLANDISELSLAQLRSLRKNAKYVNCFFKWIHTPPTNEKPNFYSIFQDMPNCWIPQRMQKLDLLEAVADGTTWKGEDHFFKDLKKYVLDIITREGYAEFLTTSQEPKEKEKTLKNLANIIAQIEKLTYTQLRTPAAAQSRARAEADFLAQPSSPLTNVITKAIANVSKGDFAGLEDIPAGYTLATINGKSILQYSKKGYVCALDVTELRKGLQGKKPSNKWLHYILNRCLRNYNQESGTWNQEEFYITPEEILAEGWYKFPQDVIAGFANAQSWLMSITLNQQQVSYKKEDLKKGLALTSEDFNKAAIGIKHLFETLDIEKIDKKTFIHVKPILTLNWQAVFQMITYLPRYAYSLNENAFSLAYYFVKMARTNAGKLSKDKALYYPYHSLAKELQAPDPREVKDIKQNILTPITKAVNEIIATEEKSSVKYWNITAEPMEKPYLATYNNKGVHVQFTQYFIDKLTGIYKKNQAKAKLIQEKLAQIEAKKLAKDN